MGLDPYIQLVNMALATWTTHVVVAQKLGEALSHVYVRSATRA
jgi:hypothetical protein